MPPTYSHFLKRWISHNDSCMIVVVARRAVLLCRNQDIAWQSRVIGGQMFTQCSTKARPRKPFLCGKKYLYGTGIDFRLEKSRLMLEHKYFARAHRMGLLSMLQRHGQGTRVERAMLIGVYQNCRCDILMRDTRGCGYRIGHAVYCQHRFGCCMS